MVNVQQDKPDDYVIATNETHTVREFLEETFSCLDMDFKEYVGFDKNMRDLLKLISYWKSERQRINSAGNPRPLLRIGFDGAGGHETCSERESIS